MGVGSNRLAGRFQLKDLGVLDGPPLRGAETVVRLALDILACEGVALLIFDDETGSAFIHAAAGWNMGRRTLPMSDSVALQVREEGRPVTIADTASDMPEAMELELLGARAVNAVPVFGPDTVPVGVLAAFEREAREWSPEEVSKVEDLAYLASQEIVLRASFETLRLLSQDRGGLIEPKH